MKYLLCLSLLGSLLGRPALAQTEAPAPFRGANTIVVYTRDSAAVALQKMARLLVVDGYALGQNDPALGYFTTVGKAVGQVTPATYTYRVVALPGPAGTALRVSGEYTIPVGPRTISESMFWVKGNLLHAKQCFSAVERVALAYPQGRVAYLLRP
jgi:hypothetical protein